MVSKKTFKLKQDLTGWQFAWLINVMAIAGLGVLQIYSSLWLLAITFAASFFMALIGA